MGKNTPKSYGMGLSPPRTENVHSFATFLTWMDSPSGTDGMETLEHLQF